MLRFAGRRRRVWSPTLQLLLVCLKGRWICSCTKGPFLFRSLPFPCKKCFRLFQITALYVLFPILCPWKCWRGTHLKMSKNRVTNTLFMNAATLSSFAGLSQIRYRIIQPISQTASYSSLIMTLKMMYFREACHRKKKQSACFCNWLMERFCVKRLFVFLQEIDSWKVGITIWTTRPLPTKVEERKLSMKQLQNASCFGTAMNHFRELCVKF